MQGAPALGDMAAHLASVARQTGRPVAEVVPTVSATIPLVLEYLWGWYGELLRDHRNFGLGANAFTHLDVQAWAAVMGHDPTPWEVRMLLRLDDEFILIANRPKTEAGAPLVEQ